jgi:hypothetical protein
LGTSHDRRHRRRRTAGQQGAGVSELVRLAVDYNDIITVEAGKRGGKPCIRGSRIAVSDVLPLRPDHSRDRRDGGVKQPAHRRGLLHFPRVS